MQGFPVLGRHFVHYYFLSNINTIVGRKQQIAGKWDNRTVPKINIVVKLIDQWRSQDFLLGEENV